MMFSNKCFLINIMGVLLMLSFNVASAATWYPGDLHRHTGFSTEAGYEGVTDSECDSESFDSTGYTVEELKDQVDAAGVHFWLSLTDHSYCLDSSEWSIIESDASAHSDSDVLFLPSEELSVDEDCISGVSDAGHLGAHGISDYIDSKGNEL